MTATTPDTDKGSDTGTGPVDSRWVIESDQGVRLRFWWALVLAVASGFAFLLAFPPFDQSWLAPIGVALLAFACHRRRLRAGFGLGYLAGAALFLPLLTWTSTQVGEVPWLLLSLFEALYLGLLGAAIAWAGRLTDRHWSWWPLILGALWTGQEALRDRIPFGGFPWGRLAFSQADFPTANVAWLGGAPFVTFLVAACGGCLVAAVGPALAGRLRAAWWGVAAVAVFVAGWAVPLNITAPAAESMTVAIVQGSVPRLGLDFNEQRRAVLDNHAQATQDLADDVANGDEKQPDVVVWPENASDIDPLSNADAAAVISDAAREIEAPIVVGTLVRDGDDIRNVSIVWDPKTGPGFTYAKQHPVPFAEYIPMRPVVRTVAGWIDQRMVDGIDRVHGFTPGQEPGLIPVADTSLSGTICFEVVYDDLVRDSVREGAELLAVQTNNATFNNAEARQQLAAVQLRSIEHGRAGLMASTVGVSGFIDAYGEVHQATGFDEQAVIVQDLPQGDSTTPATWLGVWPELVICIGAVALLVTAGVIRRRGNGSAETIAT
ncbi:MAG TPA: apolipoprotein N-acyltransferase [Candidatus Stackebrandtia faecavium]|nr:apolipoprotein N-acyltransferase [Candidatus Stackebrandtia faecavium]